MVVDTIGVVKITQVECKGGKKKNLEKIMYLYICMSVERKYLRNKYEHDW